MKRQNKHFTGFSPKFYEKIYENISAGRFSSNKEDSALFDSISEYMKGRLDLEEARNDPGLPEIDKVVQSMITDYKHNKHTDKSDANFIRDIFSNDMPESVLNELVHIKKEIISSNVNDISAEWVKEWHDKRQKQGTADNKAVEIENFIKDSLESEGPDVGIEPFESETPDSKRVKIRPLMLRYISLTAAAVIGTFILINSLWPVYDSNKMFETYYAPAKIISPVTRGNTDGADSYAIAIESYKNGDYQTADIGFSSAILKDTSPSLLFHLGVTRIATGNYDNAIEILSNLSSDPGEYAKETYWYLGLAYLKTGNKKKAEDCFTILAKTPGHYGDRSKKILRRLK
jgi:hypothetical protein